MKFIKYICVGLLSLSLATSGFGASRTTLQDGDGAAIGTAANPMIVSASGGTGANAALINLASVAINEALINLSLARGLDQMGPANQSLKLAAEFSGITQSIQSSAQLVTQVTVVLNRANDTDTVAIEAQSVSLSEADSSLELETGTE